MISNETDKALEIAQQIFSLLVPLHPTRRHQVMQALLLLLGESPNRVDVVENKETTNNRNHDIEMNGLSPQGKLWMKQNQLTYQEMQQVFLVSNESVQLSISEMPGKDGKSKVVNCYLLLGLSKLLSTGDSTFEDKVARELCTSFGCYDGKHHVRSLKKRGNMLVQSGESWQVTMPGMKVAAALVKQMAEVLQS